MKSVYRSYLKWMYTQDGGLLQSASTGLLAYPEMYVTRAPAATTLAALHSGAMGCLEMRINTSKLSDAMMRTAPAGYVSFPKEAGSLGEKIAAMTHGHPDGYRSAGAFTLEETVEMTQTSVSCSEWGGETAAKLKEAVRFADSDTEDKAAVAALGTGKTGERALAIGVFCALRHQDIFTETIHDAANHSGDSSVTASVAGQIAGAALGKEAIPNGWLIQLELAEVIEEYGKRIGDLWGML